MRRPRSAAPLILATLLAACGGTSATAVPFASRSASPSAAPSASATAFPAASPEPSRIVHDGSVPVSTGEPIELADLSGRIVFDDFEDVFVMDVDGSNVVKVASDPAGPEFDGALSPDDKWVVYRDSTRGINENDEIFVVRADGTDRRNVTNNPANDWGPAWSPDGSTIIFNSDRNGLMAGFLVDPDGSTVRELDIAAWVEYPSFSPDGKRIAFMGVTGSDYELYVATPASGEVTKLTDVPGHDAWPAWSPDGSTIAFTSHRDDCRVSPQATECWGGPGPDDTHHDIWLIEPDGSNLRRVTTEFGQFVTWSPDSQYLLISGYAMYVVRPDGTGRLELRADGIDRPLGGIPDWR